MVLMGSCYTVCSTYLSGMCVNPTFCVIIRGSTIQWCHCRLKKRSTDCDCWIVGSTVAASIPSDILQMLNGQLQLQIDRPPLAESSHVEKLQRILLGLGLLFSRQYSRTTTRNSYTVSFEHASDGERFGHIEYFVCAQGIVFAIVKILEAIPQTLQSRLSLPLNPLTTNDAPMRHDLSELSISLWEFIWGI